MGRTIMQPMGAIDFLQRALHPQAGQGAATSKSLKPSLSRRLAQQALLAVNNLMLNLFGQISPFTLSYETRADAGRI